MTKDNASGAATCLRCGRDRLHLLERSQFCGCSNNASGAGMETVAWQWRKRQTWFAGQADECHFWSEWEALQQPYMDARDLAKTDPENYELRPLVLRTDATRLLAESQAHNAKLEAQVERMRMALQANYQAMCAADRYASNCDLDDDPYIDTQMHTDCVKAGELARAALKP